MPRPIIPGETKDFVLPGEMNDEGKANPGCPTFQVAALPGRTGTQLLQAYFDKIRSFDRRPMMDADTGQQMKNEEGEELFEGYTAEEYAQILPHAYEILDQGLRGWTGWIHKNPKGEEGEVVYFSENGKPNHVTLDTLDTVTALAISGAIAGYNQLGEDDKGK